jgi:hypothetical protein
LNISVSSTEIIADEDNGDNDDDDDAALEEEEKEAEFKGKRKDMDALHVSIPFSHYHCQQHHDWCHWIHARFQCNSIE